MDYDTLYDVLEKVAEWGLPPSGHASLLDVGSSKYLKFFEKEILNKLLGQGGATVRIFEGVYGAGKTHLLDLLTERGYHNNMVVAKTDLSQAIDMHDWRLVTRHILEHATIFFEGQIVTSIPDILEALGRNGGIVIDDSFSQRLPHPGFQKAIRMAVEGYPNEHARHFVRRYLLGERVRVSDLRKFGVKGVNNPLSLRNAEQVLTTVSTGISRLGLGGMMILFDENERTLESTRASKKISRTANILRRMIDSSFTRRVAQTVVIFAVLPGFLDRAYQAYPALGQRLESVRLVDNQKGWRSPVLEVQEISEFQDPGAFLAEAVERITSLVEEHVDDLTVFLHGLLRAGNLVLKENAGSDFRRPLMKALANKTLEYI